MAEFEEPTSTNRSADAGTGSERGEMPGHGARLRQHGEELRRDGEAFSQHLGALIGDLEDEWGEQAIARPYVVIGACLAIGYVLGGGLPSGFVRFAAGMASRMAVASVARGALSTAAERG